MFRNLFRPDSPLMIVMSQITDCIFLSMFWLLGSIPVITAGTSCAALYDASYRAFRREEKHAWQRFAEVYRKNWRESILPTLVAIAAGLGLWFLMVGAWNRAVYGESSWMAFSGIALVGVVGVGILSVLFPMMSRFENSAAALLRNTVFIAVANLPRTLVLGVVNVVTILLCLRYIFPVFFAPSLAALLGSLLIEPMFKPYLNQEEAAA